MAPWFSGSCIRLTSERFPEETVDPGAPFPSGHVAGIVTFGDSRLFTPVTGAQFEPLICDENKCQAGEMDSQ